MEKNWKKFILLFSKIFSLFIEYIYVYIYICVCVCDCVFLSSISLMRHIWLNIIDILCLHIFILILSNCHMYVVISGWNWLLNSPYLTGSQVLLNSSWAIIRRVYIAKVQYSVRINFYVLWTFCHHLGSFFFFFFFLSLRFGQISPLAFFRWFTATSDRNAESCNRIPSNYSLP